MTESPAQDNSARTGLATAVWHQWWSAFAFLTRLPCPAFAPQPLGKAAWVFPAAGFAIGSLGAAAMAGCQSLGIGDIAAAAIATALIVWATGALHEDGLADCADAFGLPRTGERTQAILKDPRMGSFGVVALCLSLLMRVALAAEAGPLALIAAETVSRAAMALAMASAQPAGAGLARAAGRASLPAAFIAGTLALGFGIGLAGPSLVWGAILAGIAAAGLLRAARKRLGGYTGDVLGAVQQTALLPLLAAACIGP